MKMKRAGTIIEMPKTLDNNDVYEVKIDGENIIARSAGKQAVKDYLFIRKGQSVEIEGNIINSHIEVQSAKIDILGKESTL